MIAAWATLLKTIPHARLMLNAHSFNEKETVELFTKQFMEQGIGWERLILTRTDPWTGYARLDIALDPFPHNAGTTTFEALWMGVPVISLRERPSVGRFGDAILGAMGLSEWVADSVEDYIAIAVRLAGNLDALAQWRTDLRERMRISPLYDEAGFTRNLETAYREMWQIFCQNSKK
ncbi:hypothetical protein BN874_2860001 [Candidatus Contendobacter odensis Run_B_J11]|uniref:O-GlcNAc transferase C-terminal domain-containing protein n=1 Tax=Candidatus Contendobacter odensis Run_B_J11 TaxID=1400861 RepID=A0A7U7J4W7_9GAMM|nr:hypothetical protein BN874_2860001 [Candidatus Contendobacter odensis Run_B_J11]